MNTRPGNNETQEENINSSSSYERASEKKVEGIQTADDNQVPTELCFWRDPQCIFLLENTIAAQKVD